MDQRTALTELLDRLRQPADQQILIGHLDLTPLRHQPGITPVAEIMRATGTRRPRGVLDRRVQLPAIATAGILAATAAGAAAALRPARR
jgi:hypothetical protein